ncbi:PilZ domain-containing protein [Shewanella sp. Isolate11]|uniref:PilZ domain-containing protein n=1 Tax=Shewanella sp. Isolate11 TaxID=2908530 RepID=UPI001EFC7CFD|nr:PilZ domain-containing protein [Shewanella sp. Isolate11]MCG9697319.1 PilZ domain-containing protein [Shewanella sp. Isolate11]
MSLEQHSALIEQLKPLLMEDNFQELFEHLTAQESNSTRFLLKMELKRLSTPCTRIIDLRDKSELPCEMVKHGTQSHFLDPHAKNSFIEALALYQNQYTLGVYEHVFIRHKNRRSKISTAADPAELTQNPFIASGAVLGSYFSRSEERMNYAIRIGVLQPGVSEVNGITVDLSVGGARVRLPIHHGLNIDQPLRVKLLDLSKEYYFDDLQKGVDYQVVDVESNNQYSWMRLKRISGSEALADMLGNLIQGYKFRYKVDINDILVAAKGLGLERHYLPTLPHLALYAEHLDEQYQITHELLSRDNQQIQQYFKDEKQHYQLDGMLTPARLKAAIEHPKKIEHNLFFCFTFSNQGSVFYYSATLAELQRDDKLGLLMNFASSQTSWRIFKLTSSEIDHQTSYKSSILPGDSSFYSALTEAQLKRFSHVLQLIDLTNDKALSHYRQWDSKGLKPNDLKPYAQTKLTQNKIKNLFLEFSERRNEARFSFKTQVSVRYENQLYHGISLDISGKGLQVSLDTPSHIPANSTVLLSLPKLQPLAGNSKLVQLPYRVVRSRKNHTLLHLSAILGHSPHVGVAFLNRLIEANRDKLPKLSEVNSDIKELADGLKNLLMRKLASVPYFVEKTAKSAKLALLGVSKNGNEVSDLFAALADTPLEYDLSALLDKGQLKRDFIDPIRQLEPNAELDFFEVFVQVSRQSQGRIKLKCYQPEALGDHQAQQHFIHQSQNLGKFMALRIYRAPAAKADLNYIKREREYIAVHAQHKAKQLEQLLWRIIGVGELLDITAEVMLRYPELHSAYLDTEQ